MFQNTQRRHRSKNLHYFCVQGIIQGSKFESCNLLTFWPVFFFSTSQVHTGKPYQSGALRFLLIRADCGFFSFSPSWTISSCSRSANTCAVSSTLLLPISFSGYCFARLGAFCIRSVFGARVLSLFHRVTSSVLPSGMNFTECLVSNVTFALLYLKRPAFSFVVANNYGAVSITGEIFEFFHIHCLVS